MKVYLDAFLCLLSWVRRHPIVSLIAIVCVIAYGTFSVALRMKGINSVRSQISLLTEQRTYEFTAQLEVDGTPIRLSSEIVCAPAYGMGRNPTFDGADTNIIKQTLPSGEAIAVVTPELCITLRGGFGVGSRDFGLPAGYIPLIYLFDSS